MRTNAPQEPWAAGGGPDFRPAPQLLQLNSVSVGFATAHGEAVAVDRVSLSIARGETVAVVGESGSGKSVMSLAVMRLLASSARLTGQSILFNGRGGAVDLLRLGQREMTAIRGEAIGMVFQEPMTSLNPVHTVGDQVSEVLRIHRPVGRGEALDKAEAILARVGIPEARRRLAAFPHELSGGMRQRVMIAMALACDPLLLITDEPTTALDVTIQAQILQLLRTLRDESGQSMMFITHDLGVVAEVADRVYVMYAGQVVESGDVATLLRHPRHPYTRGLIASLPRIDRPRQPGKRFHSVPGRVAEPWNRPPGCRFQARCAMAVPGLCDVPVPLEQVSATHAVRCVRQAELEGVPVG